MKVLWLGHYREQSGWADATINSILALDSVGVEVVPVNVSLTGSNAEVPQRIVELERGNKNDCDVCIQNILPHHMTGSDRFKKNIGYVVTEGSTISMTPWVSQLNMMDAVWVPNTHNQDSMTTDLDVDVYTVPYAFDVDRYDSVYRKLDMGDANGKFKFYYVGDVNSRKNIETLIKCWNVAFWDVEDAALVLKVNKFGHTDEQLLELMTNMINNVKQGLRIYPKIEDYNKETIITQRLSNDDLLALHNTCDCFVTASRGEGWCLPAFDAMCLGNAPICVDEGGPRDFIQKQPECGQLTKYTLSPCNYPDAAFPFLNTGLDMWCDVDESHLISNMKNAYNHWKSGQWNKSMNRKHGLDSADDFAYDVIGGIMENLINE